jgi:hypothetical protein
VPTTRPEAARGDDDGIFPMTLRTLCVYCGSAVGADPRFSEAARELGALLARRGITLAYGGGGIGLMGEIARAVAAGGGRVVGVIPEHLNTRERAFFDPRVELRVTRTMHERKMLLADISDAFVALPGGLGTFDELFEILTWRHIGLHGKPVGVLNVAGYFEPFLALVRNARTLGFIDASREPRIVTAETPLALLDRIRRPGATGGSRRRRAADPTRRTARRRAGP